ncbi:MULTISPECIES: hypothetical protein [Paenibacillus]|uniref:hypothetical protein n=1 Tax=Paenibacillus TaxID=44249 RepID=UPI000B87A666|nr:MULTISPECIES: hypothetical protein [Paenibacillus]MBD8836495.1 hypothetical protein [Paenibacillus sp. CFBP 13594]PRA05017.1 hypothetical protein CQ043_13295 [Paenibacillus sp. MYb63]PRA47638.1 hypothetical protein CQ061_13535 [Paenibacillus sp. MYb67]QZN74894.1 hypothetical protein K5K90_26490 [Paenibacillus sp. DR312]
MAHVDIIDDTTLRITLRLEDATTMIQMAQREQVEYAQEIITIYEKMPVFEYTHFCFYAYDSARLFERVLGMDPKAYLSFSLDAPESFFYALYGGMVALYESSLQLVQQADVAGAGLDVNAHVSI